jgi:hypothetical protein
MNSLSRLFIIAPYYAHIFQNEEWLRTGNGTMFNEYSPHEQELLEKYRKISPEMQMHVLDYVKLLLKGQEMLP